MLPHEIDTDIYLGNNYLVLDFEVGGEERTDPVSDNNELLLAVWWYQGRYHHCWGDHYNQHKLMRHVEQADFIVAHNARYELQWLRKCGLDLHDAVVWDTMIAEKVIAGNRKWKLGLEDSLERNGLGGKDSLVSKFMKGGVDPKEIPKEWLQKYCYVDVIRTHDLFKIQRDEAVTDKLRKVVFSRCILTPVLADIEFNGVCLDKELVANEYHEESTRHAELSRRFGVLCGDINPRSSKQMAELLYERLGFSELKGRDGSAIRSEAGGRKTDKATIAGLKARNKQQRDFIELYKELKKSDTRLTKFLKKAKDCCDNDNGILRANFNQTVTDTHRLSSTGKKYGIQLQNIAREYKRLFTARHPGWKVGSADYGQLEFRIAAFLSQDKRAIEDIRTGVDVHQFTADTLTAAGEPTTRQAAKAFTFKPTFGGTSGTKAQQEYFKAFKQKYSNLARTQQSWVQEVVRTKQLETITGLIFYWPNTRVTTSGYVINNEPIHNYPIQEFSFTHITTIGTVYLWHRMRDMKSFIVNTVHDSIIAEVHPDEEEEYEKLVTKCMINDVDTYLAHVYNIHLNVPLEVDIKIKDHWE